VADSKPNDDSSAPQDEILKRAEPDQNSGPMPAADDSVSQQDTLPPSNEDSESSSTLDLAGRTDMIASRPRGPGRFLGGPQEALGGSKPSGFALRFIDARQSRWTVRLVKPYMRDWRVQGRVPSDYVVPKPISSCGA